MHSCPLFLSARFTISFNPVRSFLASWISLPSALTQIAQPILRYDLLVARAIAMGIRPVTRQAPVTRPRQAQQAWSRSLASKVISSERAVPF